MLLCTFPIHKIHIAKQERRQHRIPFPMCSRRAMYHYLPHINISDNFISGTGKYNKHTQLVLILCSWIFAQHTLIAHICLGCASCARLFDITVRSCEHICLPFTTHKPHIYSLFPLWKKRFLPSRLPPLGAMQFAQSNCIIVIYEISRSSHKHTSIHIYVDVFQVKSQNVTYL